MNRRLFGSIALATTVIALCVMVVIQSVFARNLSTFDQLDLLVDIRHELVDSYVTEPDQEKMVEAAVRGMIASLDDPYTVYLTPEDLAPFERNIHGVFSGIGAEVDIHNDRLRIVSPLEDSPAWKAGVMPGDIVLEIDGEDTAGIKITDAVAKLTGEAGTDVTIKVRHDTGEEELITITRAVIEVDTVRGYRTDADQHPDFMIDKDNRIGYVRLTQFNERTAGELEAAIQSLQEQNARALILDLRFNPGGLLESALQVSDMFLGAGQRIVSIKGRTVAEQTHDATANTLAPNLPVIVLINEGSASAAEIVSGALHDHQRAHIVGTRTFGKGSVQQVRMLDSGQGALKITNAYYYIPSGRKIHRVEGAEQWGVDPSDGSYVPMKPEDVEQMIELRRDAGIKKLYEDAEGNPIALDPTIIREQFADPQLAAALRAALGRVKDGAFPKVGQSNEEQLIKANQLANLEQQKQFLQERLDEIEDEMARLAAGQAPAEDDESPTQ
ncbi:MAG: PDZ domain-containing protein [Planctomycetes bacterium]|jgi:carboxyl-terminal processing protease|nr:PDZ domain-containing protein [Planctomycetota bacterium]